VGPRRVAASAAASALALLLLSSCGSSPAAPPAQNTTGTTATAHTMTPGDHVISLTVDGRARSFLLHVPPNPAVHNRPLILVFHGAEDSDESTAHSTDFEKVADQVGEVVAFLQGYEDTWNEGAGHTPAEQAHVDDVAFTSAVIAKIEGLVTFDHARIAAAGFSNGALMVEYLGCRLAGQLAVVVPVEGELPVTVAAGCSPSRPISVYEVHGTADAVIPYGGGPFHGVGGGTTVLAAPASVARWAALDDCSRAPSVTTPAAGVTLTAYTACRGHATVTLRTIAGGTHQWGSSIGLLVTEALSR
jgi:polyhydroxybutyrate depolymerase